jgi:Cu+-exporting ATPase
LKDIDVSVRGMHCAACAAGIEKGLKKLDGVAEAAVNLLLERAHVVYDETKTDEEAILGAIRSLGFDASLKTQTVSVGIGSMHCAACAASVEKALRALKGVASAEVNLATETATIEYDAALVHPSEFGPVVEHLGFTVRDLRARDYAEKAEEEKQLELARARRRLWVSGVFSAILLYIAMGPMIGLPVPAALDHMRAPLAASVVQLVLCIPVIAAGFGFYTRGFGALWRLSPNMDSLVALGTLAAFCYSAVTIVELSMGIHASAEVYFESVGVIITLIMLGKYLEARAKGRTGRAVRKLMELTPKTASLLRNGEEIKVPVETVQAGDRLLVRRGERVPVDGVIVRGSTWTDESLVTGESMPVEKGEGDEVIGATINTSGVIEIQAKKVGRETLIAQIIDMVEKAQGSKAPIAKLADVVAGRFVPAVLGVAFTAAAAWLIGGAEVGFALEKFVAVLVIACPCALGLATPTAIMVGMGKGAQLGVLFKDSTALERMHHIQSILFDKTGTVTMGRMSVVDVVPVDGWDEAGLLKAAASAEKASEHPLSAAVAERAKQAGIAPDEVRDFTAVAGQGVRALWQEREVLVGNRRMMEAHEIDSGGDLETKARTLQERGCTVLFVAVDAAPAGLIAIEDQIKENSAKAIAVIREMGVTPMLVTGDNRLAAQAVAARVGIEEVQSEVLPGDKAHVVEELQEQGRVVAMVGDGVNDAPALAQADIGIAVGSGTDIAMEAADVVLVKGDILHVARALRLSKRTLRIIRQNLFWAFGYNVVCIPVAAGLLQLFGGIGLNPMIAAAAMSLSSVSVVTNALRLSRFEPGI